jgi:hypothetical protein
MEALPTMPVEQHENGVPEFDQIKQERRQRVYDMQMERNSALNRVEWSPLVSPV